MNVQAVMSDWSPKWRKAGYPDYSWWIPVLMIGSTFVGGALAVAQRAGSDPLLPTAALVLVALSPWLFALTGHPMPWGLCVITTISALATLIVLFPVDYDASVILWVMMVGHIAATERLSRSLITLLFAWMVVAGLAWLEGIDGWALWMVGISAGWDVGFVLQYQQRRYDEQTRLYADNQVKAVLEERQRIAREVHDVVAHSLSVTMLHLTAARRNLEEDGDAGVDEAVAALRDAEQLGRQAMNDIRSSVSMLGQEQGVSSAAPDADDIPGLVEDFRDAGLDVSLDLRGDTTALPATAGLGLFRIVQESLANIAKHAPGAQAAVVLDLEKSPRLSIWNSLERPVPQQPGGSGLNGMRERADALGASFSAGQLEGSWVVDVQLPAAGTPPRRLSRLDCPLPLPFHKPATSTS